MKIGLLTVYSFNYGSFYQARALQLQLQKMGHECELINEQFKKDEWMNLKLLYTFHDVVPAFLRPLICKILPQYNTFLKLQKDVSVLEQSPASLRKIEEITKRYDCVVLGSDELWSANSASIRYTPAYFGYGITCPHITYAPSATLFNIEDEEVCSKVREGMDSYEQIAVRDVHSKEVVKKVTGRDVPVVLDPTLLNPFFAKEEDALVKGEYVLLYGQHYDEAQRSLIRKVAKDNKMKIMALGWPQDFADGFLNPETAEEFQQAFVNAAYSFPSTFHGTIFSILHQRPFLSMLNPLRGGKVKMLLEQIGLSERIYNEKITPDWHIDYQKVFQRIDVLRQESLSYLTKALEKYEVVSGRHCCGCGACKAICPVGAIAYTSNNEGFIEPLVDQKQCIHCKQCITNCPMHNRKKQLPKRVVGFRDTDEERVKNSSSGGAFSKISDVILKNEGYVAGAVFDEKYQVKTVLTSETLVRDQMRGSKYVQGDCTKIYEQIKEALIKEKQVLFTGTPCQCAGVKAYVDAKLGQHRDKLFLVDIVCHGTPSPLVWQKYLKYVEEQQNDKIAGVTFRSKQFGWHKQAMKIKMRNGKTLTGLTTQNPYYIMYFSHVCHRTSCHECPFASYERASDLTIGDFWGIDDLTEQDPKNRDNLKKLQNEAGTSLVFINTEQGDKLFQQCQKEAIIYESNLGSCYQAIFENPPKVSAKRATFFKTLEEETFDQVVQKYGTLHLKEKVVKFVIAPVVKKLGIYNLAQRIYFGGKKGKG